jgi:hypothetical protein
MTENYFHSKFWFEHPFVTPVSQYFSSLISNTTRFGWYGHHQVLQL